MSTPATSLQDPVDVAIVGGGAAGTYTGYRLLTADPDQCPELGRLLSLSGRQQLEVHLFESLDRIGGRLWTYQFPDLPGLKADLGGMGYTKVQQNTWGLVEELKLPYGPFLPYQQANIQFLRTARFLYDQYYVYSAVPYHLKPEDRGLNPTQIYLRTIYRSIPGLEPRVNAVIEATAKCDLFEATRASNELTEFLRHARIENMPGEQALLTSNTFTNLIERENGNEALDLLLQASVVSSWYGSFNLYDLLLAALQVNFSFYYPAGCKPSNPNSRRVANILAIMNNLHTSPAAFAIDDGYQVLPETMAREMVKAGGHVHLETRLRRIEVDESSGERLLVLHFERRGSEGRTIVHARHAVLGLPKYPLLQLERQSVLFSSPQFRADVETVTSVPAAKIFMTFPHAWWHSIAPGEEDTLLVGYSNTDLPISTTYYLGVAENRRGLVLTSLTDLEGVSFWSAYRENARFGPQGEPLGAHSDPGLHLHAPPLLVKESYRQLLEMHGYPIPEPEQSLFIDWTLAPFGGAWHQWNPQQRSWEVIPRIRRPIKDLNLYLCGEAYSAGQGWVEGALNTAEMVLETYFGLPRPNWVLPNYDFGP